jgi:hypothetical protein
MVGARCDALGVHIAAQPRQQADHLAGGHSREPRQLTGQVPHAPLHGDAVPLGVQAEQGCVTRLGPDQAHEQPDRRRLAGHVGPMKPRTPARNVQVEVDESPALAVVLGEAAGSDGHPRPVLGRGAAYCE